MSERWAGEEQDRFEAMKHLRISGRRRISLMVPELKRLGLLECRKCGDPANQRKNSLGETICKTCEDTASIFWSRNIERLRVDEVKILELTWEWVATKQAIQERCLARGEPADLRLASSIADQLALFGGVDIEIAPDPDGDDAEVQNVPRGLAIRRAPARRHADPVN